MSTVMGEDIKRWTSRPKCALVTEIFKVKTPVDSARRAYDSPPCVIENWMEDARGGMENSFLTQSALNKSYLTDLSKENDIDLDLELPELRQ